MKQSTLEFWFKAALFVGVIAFSFAVVLGVWWLLWQLWCFVLPQVYPGGPEALIAPSYWLFAGMWTLLVLIGKALRGSRSN